MPKNAAIIGRVAVKVIPDTDNFRSDAQRQLDAIEKELKPLQIQFDVDTAKLIEQVTAARDAAQASLRDLTVKVRVDNSGLNGVSDQLGSLDHQTVIGGGTSRIDVQIDEKSKADALAELAAMRSQIRDMVAHIHIDVSQPDIDKAKAELAALHSEVDRLNADVRVHLDRTSSAETSARLDALARPRDVSIKPEVNNAALLKAAAVLGALSGGRTYMMKVRGVSEFIQGLDLMIPRIAASALALGALSIASLTTASNILVLAGNIAVVSGVALALPGILAGIGIGLAITMNAFSNLKKALPDVYKEWQNVKNQMTVDFWSQASEGIRKLAGLYLPQLSTTAKTLGGFWGKLGDSLAKPFQTVLPQMFDNLNNSINIAGQHTASYAGIISILGSVGSAMLPRLANWVGQVADKFNGWLIAKQASGELQGMIDAGITALSHMGDIIVQTGRIFGGLIKAADAGGGSTLAALSNGLKSVADTINSPAFQTGLTNVFQAAHDGFSNLAQVAGPAVKAAFLNIGATLTAVLPQIGSILGQLVGNVALIFADPRMMAGVQSLVDGIDKAMAVIAPNIQQLAGPISQIMGVIGELITILGPIFATAMAAIGPVVSALAPPLTNLISILGGAFVGILKQLEPVIVLLANAFADFLTNGGIQFISQAVGGLMQVIVPLAQAFGTIASTIMAALLPILPTLGNMFVLIGQALGTFITQLVNALVPVLPVIIQAFFSIMQAILPLIPVLLDALAPILPVIANLFAQIATAIAPVVVQLVNALAPILPMIVQAFGALVNALAPVIPQLIAGLAPVLPVLADAFMQILNALLPLLPVFMNLLTAIIIPLLPLFMNLVTSILPPLATMITNLASSLLPFIQALTEIVNFLMPILIPVLMFLADMVIGAVMGAINGVVNMFRGFMDILTGLWDIVSGIFTGSWSKVWEGIKDVFKGVWEFIGGLIEFIWNVVILATLVSAIGFVKGIFTEGLGFIVRLWETCWGGIRDFFGNIWKALKDAVSGGISNTVQFFKDLPGKVMDAVGSLLQKLKDFGGNLLSGLWDGLKGATAWLMQKIGDFFGDLLPGWVKDILGIHSPSKVFAEIGSWLLPGLAQGMTSASSLQNVKEAVGTMHSSLVSEVNTGVLYDSGVLLSNSLLDGMESQYDSIKGSLKGLGNDLSNTDIQGVTASGVSTSVNSAASSVMTTPGGNTLIYNAAPNNSVDSDEELFAAATRARMGW